VGKLTKIKNLNGLAREGEKKMALCNHYEYSLVQGVQDFNVPAGRSGLREVRGDIDQIIDVCAQEWFLQQHHSEVFGAARIGGLVYKKFFKIQSLYEGQDEIFKRLCSAADFAINFFQICESLRRKWNSDNVSSIQEQELLVEEKDAAYETLQYIEKMISPEEYATLMIRVADYKDAEYDYFHPEERGDEE